MLNGTYAAIYRAMLYGGNETSFVVPKSLIDLHDRIEQMIRASGRTRLDQAFQWVVVALWEQTTEEGKDFARERAMVAAESAKASIVPDENVKWSLVEAKWPITVTFDGVVHKGLFISEKDENNLTVKIPALGAWNRVVDKKDVRLAVAS